MPQLLEEICQRFDDAWAKDERPRIEDFLAQLPQSERSDALRQLIAIDMRRRQAAGQSPSSEDYAALDSHDQQDHATCVSTCTQGHAASQAEAKAAPIPDQVGRYRIERVLGAGAFGMVVAAWDEELDRLVAIKVPTAKASPAHLARQTAEARAAARLSHRGIVAVFDCGRLPDERFYIVSEYVDGQTLAEQIEDERLSLRRVVEIMAELAEAVHHAHLHGLFHRDLKPSNILVDRHGQVRVTDFGLVLDEDEQHAFAGEVAGSPAYMSPEQVQGQSHFLDGRTDIWSLGVIFYELLTGRRPFRGPLDQLRAEILERSPRPPRQIDDTIPSELERCCLKCLERPLAQRYSSAIDLAADLRAWLKQEDALAAAKTPAIRPQAKRVLAAVAVLVAVLVAFGLWAFFSNRLHGPGGPAAQASGLRSSAILQSASPPRGLWIPLLDEAPRVLHWPLVPQNSDRSYRSENREFSLSSDQFAMMEIGRTTARDFRLRARLHQAAWTGDAGIFWGYQERDEERQRQYQTIWLQPYERSARQRRPFHATWKSMLVTPDGRTNADRALQSWQPPAPAGQEVDVEIIVRDGRLSQLLWNGKDVGKVECRDPTVEPGPDDSIGAFGVVVDGSTILIRNAAFYLYE